MHAGTAQEWQGRESKRRRLMALPQGSTYDILGDRVLYKYCTATSGKFLAVMSRRCVKLGANFCSHTLIIMYEYRPDC